MTVKTFLFSVGISFTVMGGLWISWNYIAPHIISTLERITTTPPTIVIAPGYKITIDGKAAQIFGRSVCTREGASLQFLSDSPSYEADECVVITPDTMVVPVRLVIDGKLMDEKWTVDRPGSAQVLRRPNGSLVGIGR